MKRTILLVAVFIVTLCLSTVTASAAPDNSLKNGNPIEVEPFWINASTVTLNISYSGGTATCTGTIKGISTVNSITATYTLKRVNSNGTTTTVKTWSGLSSSTSYFSFSNTYSTVSKGETYRLEVSATLTTTSGVKETVSDFITKTY